MTVTVVNIRVVRVLVRQRVVMVGMRVRLIAIPSEVMIPRALAVFKLMTRSNRVNCSTGNSLRNVPLRILSI